MTEPSLVPARVPVLNRLQLMQFLAVYVARDFCYWASGHVRAERIERGWTLPEKHSCNASHAIQQWRRRNGLARAKLVVLDPHASAGDTWDGDHARWWMIATGPLEGEDLYDARRGDERITLGNLFEMVRLPIRGNGPSWTWRVQPAGWEDYRRRGLHYAKKKDLSEANKFMLDLAQWPGAAGLNEQRRDLFREMKWVSNGRLRPPAIAWARFKSLKGGTVSDSPFKSVRTRADA